MINDISIHHSPLPEKHIKQMDKNVADMQKENKDRCARLIQKLSELSSRQHELSEKKLIHTKLKEENKKKKEAMTKCQKQIDEYRSQINLIKKQISKEKTNLKSIISQISQNSLTGLTSRRTSISKRKKNINEFQEKMKNLMNEDKNLDLKKQKLVQLIDSKQQSLLSLTSREEKVSEAMQIPIDDLRLEELTVNKLEQFISQVNSDIDLNESSSFTSNYNEELYVKKLEQENQSKKNRINKLKESIKFLKTRPPAPKIRKVSATPTKWLNKLKPVSYDENRLLRFNSTINSFKERQKMIDQLENTTTNVQIAWANDQKQIEDSWMGKMDDMQVLQKKVDEIDNLIFDIDELSEKIHQLKEEESLLNERKSECEKSKSKIELKLYEIGECHNTIQRQVDNYIKKKEKLDQTAESLKRKKKNILILRNEIKQLDDLYQQYRIKVKAIETKANEIKNSFNMSGYQPQIIEPLDHVKFSSHKTPQQNEFNKLSNSSPQTKKKEEKFSTPKSYNEKEISKINSSPISKKKEEDLTTPKSKINKNHDKLSDSTFSMHELENENSANSIIDNNSINYSNNKKSITGNSKYYDTNILDSKNISNYNKSINNLQGNSSSFNLSDMEESNDKYNSIKSNKVNGESSPSKNISERKYSPIINKSKKIKKLERKSEININNSLADIKNGSGIAGSIHSSSLTNGDMNQDSQRSEIEIEFSDNENTKSVDKSIIKNQSMTKSEMKFSTASKFSHNSKDSKLDSMKKIIKEEQEEEHILSKYTSFTAKENMNKENQYSSDFIHFNPNEYEAILNCSDSSRSAFLNNNNSMKPNDTTFKSAELEDYIIEEEEEEKPENEDKIRKEIVIVEEEDVIDVFDNVSTSYQVDSNPIFPTPEIFSDKNSNIYEYSKEMSDVEAASASAAAISDDDKDFQTTELKNLFSESTKSQITPTKRAHPSKIDIEDVTSMETPNPNRYRRNHQISQLDDDSDDEFDHLVKEAQNAIELPLLKSKYQSP